LFQYSTLGSLMAGVYDGEMTCAQLKEHGDLGLGTFNALDGEMVVVDHQVYQVTSDGVASLVDDGARIPFAVVTYFESDQRFEVAGSIDCEQLKARLDSVLPTPNIPHAIRVTGSFAAVTTRSVPRQDKPYPKLLEVVREQPTFDLEQVDGVMVGFRLPSYMDKANAPGYHFHFITAGRDAGGHVLSCELQDVVVDIDYTDQWYTVLPADEAFYAVEMSQDQYR